MLTLINTNLMRPPIAPLGLDYLAGAARAAGIEVEVVDLCLAERPAETLRAHFRRKQPLLVGLTLRNVDDSFWPSAQSFLEPTAEWVRLLRELTDAPLVLGGAGFSIFARRIVEYTGADYGVRGDGEAALVELYQRLSARRPVRGVPGLVSREGATPPAWRAEEHLRVPTARDAVDNAAYFRLGGQVGLETKRGCPVACNFCADRLAKGRFVRARPPADVADEAEALLAQGADVLHLCDAEFNVPVEHARAVCAEFLRRGLGARLRWYTYMAVTPFDADLARAMRAAGCVGINFTGPAASRTMLRVYGQRHQPEDLAATVEAARDAGLVVMVDLMLGGPGETPETVREALDFLKSLNPDCVGVGLGVRLYPGLPLTRALAAQGPLESNPGVRRRYPGKVDLLWPTYYVSPALGERPAALVRECLAGDQRFFEPADEPGSAGLAQKDHNYNDSAPLVRAIAAGARGAYWDILRKLRA